MGPSESQLLEAFDQAPEAIQESLTEGGAVDFMASLTDQYNLHIDTAGYISGFIRNMLLGFIRPEEFMGKLKSVGLSDDVARKLTNDLNKQVFMPLRDSVRGGSHTSSRGEIPHVPVMNISLPEPVKKPVQEKASAPIQPSYNLIQEAPVKPVLAQPESPISQQTAAFAPTVRTMQHDMELVQQGNQPVSFPVSVSMPHPSQSTPARMFQTASVPVTSTPALTQRSEPLHVVPDARPQLSQAPQIASVRGSSSDPYREPI